MCLNLKLLFDLVDLVFNPRGNHPSSSPIVTVRHFFPSQEVLSDADVSRLLDSLKASDKSRKPERLNDFRNLEVRKLTELFDKANKQNVNDA